MSSRILPSLAILIAIATFFIYVHPTWRGSIAEKRAAIELNNQALAAAEDYKEQQNQLAAERANIDPADLERLESFLPDSVDNVGLILDLNALAARSGLSLTNIDVITNDAGSTVDPVTGAPQMQSPTGSVNLSVSAIGTFSSLITFLTRVELSQRLLDVQDIIVKGSNSGVYNYQMVIRLYWLR